MYNQWGLSVGMADIDDRELEAGDVALSTRMDRRADNHRDREHRRSTYLETSPPGVGAWASKIGSDWRPDQMAGR